ITKLFRGEYVKRGIQYIKITEIGAHLPTFKQHPEVMDRLPDEVPPTTSFGPVIALFHLLKPEVTIANWVKDWKCSNEIKKEAESLAWAYNYFIKNGLDQWLVYHLHQQQDQNLIHLVRILDNKTINEMDIRNSRSQLPIRHQKELAINGHDLLQWFPERKQGPWLKHAIQTVEKNIVYGKLKNKKDHIKEWLKWNLPETN